MNAATIDVGDVIELGGPSNMTLTVDRVRTAYSLPTATLRRRAEQRSETGVEPELEPLREYRQFHYIASHGVRCWVYSHDLVAAFVAAHNAYNATKEQV